MQSIRNWLLIIAGLVLLSIFYLFPRSLRPDDDAFVWREEKRTVKITAGK